MAFRIISILHRLHRDRRGNIGVLMLLTVWCLVSLMAMVWNTGEVATKRQNLQTAVDSAAQSEATWLARITNLVTAQNMVICQDGSMEAIWRAVPPADQRVRAELENELAEAQKLLSGDEGFQKLRDQMLKKLQAVDTEYAQVSGALANVQSQAGGASSDPKINQKFGNDVRQAGVALNWTQNTYVNGQPPASNRQPNPPGPRGEGLRQLVQNWSPPDTEVKLIQAVIASLNQQLVVLGQFEARSAPGEAQNVPAIAAAHEAEVFDNERQMADQLSATALHQMKQHADFYNVQLTLAVCGNGAQSNGPAQLQPPFALAADIPSVSHYDSLSGQTITIDPINVHADEAKIWSPNVQAAVPHWLLQMFPGLPAAYTINCNIADGWGHLYAAPIHRYFNERVGKDEQGLQIYMQQIDDLRRQLAELLNQLRGLPPKANIASLPMTISDSQTNVTGGYDLIPVLPRLTSPAGATDELRAAVDIYNKHGGTYTGAVRSLQAALVGWVHYYDRFTRPFAVSAWHGAVNRARALVLKNLGISKQFMVLATYQLRSIPEWAQAGASVSAESAIRDRIVTDNIGPVSRAILSAMVGSDPRGAGGGYLDPTGKDQYLGAFYSQWASAVAYQIVNTAAARVSPLIAAEWVSRPWPYEITPPDQQVPPAVGMITADRQRFFTLLMAARPQQTTQPKLFMSKLMGNPQTPQLLAHGQAEAFNWMEFHRAYGGGERFDQVTWGTEAGFVGCPVPWRLSTEGGWNWHPRLATADALSAALQNNPELSDFFQQAGIIGNDADSVDKLTLH